MKTEVTRPNALPYWGLDPSPEDRPGVPREAQPHRLAGAHWIEPTQQPIQGPVLTRAGLCRPTRVFSTALPPTGPSGALRRIAYSIPDHRAPHWVLLLLADRVDVVQNLPASWARWLLGACEAGAAAAGRPTVMTGQRCA